jgi:hypothetical protein
VGPYRSPRRPRDSATQSRPFLRATSGHLLDARIASPLRRIRHSSGRSQSRFRRLALCDRNGDTAIIQIRREPIVTNLGNRPLRSGLEPLMRRRCSRVMSKAGAGQVRPLEVDDLYSTAPPRASSRGSATEPAAVWYPVGTRRNYAAKRRRPPFGGPRGLGRPVCGAFPSSTPCRPG